MKQQSMVSSFDGTQLFLCKDLPTQCNAILIFAHGLCGHHGRYDALATACCAQNIGCYRFDHRGHGRSEGERTFYSDRNELTGDVNVVVDLALREHPGVPLFLMGHGMGGLAALLYGCIYPGKVNGVITSGALTCDHKGLLASITPSLNPHVRLPNDLVAELCSVASVKAAYASDPYNTKTFTAGLCQTLQAGVAWLCLHRPLFAEPILMLHGDQDSVVLPQDTFDTFHAIGSQDKQMNFYGGRYHQIFHEARAGDVTGDALQWILSRLHTEPEL